MVFVANHDPSVLLISLEDPYFLDIVVALDRLQRDLRNLSPWVQATEVQGNVGLRHVSISTVKLIGNPFSINKSFYIHLMLFLKNNKKTPSSRAAWNRFIAWKLSSNILKMKSWYVSYLALTVTAQHNLVLPIRSKQRKQQLSDCESLLTSININIEFPQVDLTVWGMPKFSV